MKLFFLAASFLFILSISEIASAADDWKLARVIGKVNVVLIDKSNQNDESYYSKIVDKICVNGKFCMIKFWSNKKYVPKAFPMSDDESKHLLADYVQNPNSGLKQLHFSCEIVNDKNRCFTN